MKSAALALIALFAAACSPPAPSSTADVVEPAASAGAPVDSRAVVAKPESALQQMKLETPVAGARLTSPFKVAGAAPGFWYFEAVFPITLVDETGKLLAEAPGQAKDDWMTEKPVRFESEVQFTVAEETKAWLVLAKDNPSGEAVNDGEVRVPVTLLPPAKP
jgi:hypothetical protein